MLFSILTLMIQKVFYISFVLGVIITLLLILINKPNSLQLSTILN